MTPWEQVLVTLAGTFSLNAAMGFIVYGKLTQRVTDLVGWNKTQDTRLDGHDGLHRDHTEKIAYLRGQRWTPRLDDVRD